MGTKSTLTILACAALAATANADITIFNTSGLIATFETVQFNDPGLTLLGPVVEGSGSTTGLIVEFFGAGEDLQAVAAGAARVTGVDGAFADLSIQLQDSTYAFENMEFNLIAMADGDVTITAHSTKGGTTIETFALSESGNNRFTILSSIPDQIALVEISATVDIQDIRQLRFNGVQVVPEPGTILALGAGLLLLASRRRRI